MRVFFMGDIHGRIDPLIQFKNRLKNKLTKEDTIILLGDAGFNFHRTMKDHLFKQAVCDELRCKFFVIRGNHELRPSTCMEEEPDRWVYKFTNINTIEGWMYNQPEYPNIYYASDNPDIYSINGYRTLVLPGAYSVDKFYRLERGLTWYSNEQMTGAEKELGLSLIESQSHFDFVLSHTCPLHFEPTDLFLPVVDQSTVDKSTERYLQLIENMIGSYNFWLWGHYHAFRVYPAPREDNTHRGQKIMLYNDKVLELEDIIKGDYYNTI